MLRKLLIALVLCACGGAGGDLDAMVGASDARADARVPIDATPPIDAFPPVEGGEARWGVAAIGGGDTRSWAVDLFADDSVLVTTRFFGAFTLRTPTQVLATLLSQSNEKAALIRLGLDGSFAWIRRVGSGGANYVHDVAILPDQSIAVIGRFGGQTTFGEGETNETTLVATSQTALFPDTFVARLGADGNLQWVQYVPEALLAVLPASGDGMTVFGTFDQTVTLGAGGVNETTLTAAAWGHYVAVLELDGSLRSATLLAVSDSPTQIRARPGPSGPSGRAVLFGSLGADTTWFPGTADQFVTTDDGTTSYVMVLDDGALAWYRLVRGSASVQDVDIAANSDVLVAGTMLGSTTLSDGASDAMTLSPLGTRNAYVARYSGADGALVWAIREGQTFEEGFGIAARPSAGFVLAGRFSYDVVIGGGNGALVQLSGDAGDAFFAAYDDTGALQWARAVAGTTGLEYAYDVVVPSTNQPIGVGQFRGAAVFGAGEPGQFQLGTTATGQAGYVVALEP